ncbi:Activating signal cointegrator 1 [Seminavis robusta]|uniref:Activating signal cointegrator 1 n=1 Tax=Seminavis robusta TaxID=568900 RepID=A0A9N8EXE8_9STRA|nr:Activating signal cointegrator 1 [Seminavis robusta]|eukprot:Sro1977_g308960.1 Activating signal cointegrator 1 (310) ;mRNA; r:16221-17150
MTSERKWLETKLGDFLGFQDDSLAEVLDHLLSIESEGDLLDYLEQLLGSRDDDVRAFVQNIGQFQRGQPVEGIKEEETAPKDEVAAATPAPAKTSAAGANKKPKNDNNKAKSAPKTTTAVPKTPPQSTAKSPTNATPGANKSPTGNTETAASKEQSTTKNETTTNNKTSNPEPPKKKKYGLPPKGQAKRNCGCFGTLHKPLTNCLYCGRISCAEEGFDFCPYCGYLVEEPILNDPTKKQDKAWQHKERLLRYDRDAAKRTVVLDDQADYYSNQNNTWLTEEEQDDAYEKDSDQRNNLHTRQKQTLNIAF